MIAIDDDLLLPFCSLCPLTTGDVNNVDKLLKLNNDNVAIFDGLINNL